ncbi:GntR family transcriptional regulator [Streptomyces sp. NPDC013157]|uniref:GntR family transcriptional regulator n=1 Tax=Streptomyces sp. NPDC013157 TaxID=3364861 RepID=UPI0036BB0C81
MAGAWQVSTWNDSSAAAYHTLRDRILTGELVPGDRLAARPIATELGLEQFPVRNALIRLVQDGLVHLRTGYRVAPLTTKCVDDLFCFWTELGPEIARLGVTRAGTDQIDALRRLIAELGETLGMEPARDRIRRSLALADAMFHLLAVATDNSWLVEIYLSLAENMMRTWSVVLAAASHQDVLQTAPMNWRPVVDRRDGDLAAETTRRFLETSREIAVHVLREPIEGQGTVVPLRS